MPRALYVIQLIHFDIYSRNIFIFYIKSIPIKMSKRSQFWNSQVSNSGDGMSCFDLKQEGNS